MTDFGAEQGGALLTGARQPIPWSAYARRLLSINLYLLVLALLVSLFPLWLLAALAIDALRPRRWAVTRMLLFFVWYLGLEALGVAIAGLLWLTHGAWRRDREQAFTDGNVRLQRWWARTLGRGIFALFDLRLQAEGAEVARQGPYFLLMRHSGVADTMLPIMLVGAPFGVQLRWVMKCELLWDPCLDIVGHRLRNCFVDRVPERRGRDLDAIASLAEALGPRDGVLLYPEGTRFSAAKRERVLARLKERDPAAHARAQAWQHVLPPRAGGLLALMDRDPTADVVFCAHRGLEGASTMLDLCNGKLTGNTVHVRFWRVRREDIPLGRAARVAWLHDEWARVETHVAQG